jgi:chromosome segregation ATPase
MSSEIDNGKLFDLILSRLNEIEKLIKDSNEKTIDLQKANIKIENDINSLKNQVDKNEIEIKNNRLSLNSLEKRIDDLELKPTKQKAVIIDNIGNAIWKYILTGTVTLLGGYFIGHLAGIIK